MKFVCILTTAPNKFVARKLAHALLENKLAACVNLIPAVESHYRWKGKLEKSREIQLVIKARAALFKKIEKFIQQNHPYEVPEIIAVPISIGSHAYLDWISKAAR